MKADQSIWLMKCMRLESIQHLMYITAFSHICFASAEHTKETVFCVHAVLISHNLSSLNLLMMKLDFFGLEHLAVKGQKKSTYLPPPHNFPTTTISVQKSFYLQKSGTGTVQKVDKLYCCLLHFRIYPNNSL